MDPHRQKDFPIERSLDAFGEQRGFFATVSGSGSGEGPQAAPGSFEVRGRVYSVGGVADWWPDAEMEHFKVRTTCGALFLLHHHRPTGRWLAQWLMYTDA